MGQLVLISGLSVLLLGTCSPSSDQEGRLVKLRESVVQRQADQDVAARREQDARQQFREAHLADCERRTRQAVLRMEQAISRAEASLKANEKKFDNPRVKAWSAPMLERLNKQRSELQRLREGGR